MRSTVLLSVLLLVGGCKRTRATPTDGPTPPQLGDVDASCVDSTACREGLVCANNATCQVADTFGTTPLGGLCAGSVECAVDLVCNGQGTCVAEGTPGTGNLEDACEEEVDCQNGLTCYEEQCLGYPVERLDRPDCPFAFQIGQPGNPYRVLHSVDNASHQDFYQQPFPANARNMQGPPDLSSHPSFGVQSPFGDFARDVLDAYTREFDGYGANSTVFMRVSAVPSLSNVSIGLPLPPVSPPSDPLNAQRGTVGVVDLTEGQSFGQLVGVGWKLRTHQPHLCDPWMAMYPSNGRPFRSGHTYGAFVTEGLLGGADESGNPVAPAVEPTFAALLGNGAPADASLADAYASFAPMRSYLSEQGVEPDTIRGGTVFTVEDYQAAGASIRASARNAGVPAVTDLLACGAGPGPHADPNDASRGCFGIDPDVHELQGALSLPHVQRGSAPFVDMANGGDADWSVGEPEIQTFSDVTFALTVPRGPAPVDGWPVVLFAAGADENYRTFITEGLAERWSSISTDSGTAGFAVISIDTWLTGPRAGTVSPSWLELFPPGAEEALLYDNPLNPLAVRDNVTQSAVDWFSVVRWLESQDWSTTSPAGEPLPLDLDTIWMVGQGIGGRAAPLVAAYEPGVKGLVVSATGGLWSQGLAERTVPLAPHAVLAPALADPTVDRFQPIVALAQQLIDRTDGSNHGRFVHFEAELNRDILHVVSDNPAVGVSSQQALARGLFVEQVVQDGATPIDRMTEISAPVSANMAGSTAVAVVNVGADPHRLLYDNDRTVFQVDQFMATGALTGRARLPTSL